MLFQCLEHPDFLDGFLNRGWVFFPKVMHEARVVEDERRAKEEWNISFCRQWIITGLFEVLELRISMYITLYIHMMYQHIIDIYYIFTCFVFKLAFPPPPKKNKPSILRRPWERKLQRVTKKLDSKLEAQEQNDGNHKDYYPITDPCDWNILPTWMVDFYGFHVGKYRIVPWILWVP